MKRAGLFAIAAAAIALGIGGSTAQAVPGGSGLKATIDVQAPADDQVTPAHYRRYRHCHRWPRRYCHGGYYRRYRRY